MLKFKKLQRHLFLFILALCLPSLIYSHDLENGTSLQNFETPLIDHSKSMNCKSQKRFAYFLYVQDFINSLIEIPTSSISVDSTTVSSSYFAGRAPVYNLQNEKVGFCSASFLNMQSNDGTIVTDISNYLSIDNGLIVSWFTPSTPLNLELDSIIHSMVTECIVTATTKIGYNPYYGKQFNMVVSSDNQKIYFLLKRI